VIPAARIATPARVRVARRWVMEGLSRMVVEGHYSTRPNPPTAVRRVTTR
jgi:hypothetical protein